MLSPNDHPGIMASLMGLVVIVFVGVGLSLLADGRSGFLEIKSSIQSEIDHDKDEIFRLKDRTQEASSTLNDQIEQSNQFQKQTDLASQIERTRLDQAHLSRTRSELNSAIIALESLFSDYRREYRRKIWALAVGEKIHYLKLKDGREYRLVTISKITDVGLEIRHADGIARIQAPDLDPIFQDRFQWDDEQRRKLLEEESEPQNDPRKDVLSVTKKSAAEVKADLKKVKDQDELVERGKLHFVQARVKMVKAKMHDIRRDKSESDSMARYGSQKSVVGSLETFRNKSVRLENAYAQAQVELATAMSELAEISPGNPLLQMDDLNFE
jgi:hypothetical protein